MTQYQLTLDSETCNGCLATTTSCASCLEAVVNQVLEAQVSEHVQAEPYERTRGAAGVSQRLQAAPAHHAGGHAARCVCPRCATASFSPSSSSAINAANRRWSARSWRWWSTASRPAKSRRSPRNCAARASPSRRSPTCARASIRWSAPGTSARLAEQRYPFVLVDALVLKIREGGRVRARSALLGDWRQ